MLGGFLKRIPGQHRREALEASGNGRRAATPSQSGAVMAHADRQFRVARVTLAAFHPVHATGRGRTRRSFPQISTNTIGIGAKVVGRACYLAFQMAEVAIMNRNVWFRPDTEPSLPTPLGALPAQLRRPRPQSATAGLRK
jgi:hypothetical protein